MCGVSMPLFVSMPLTGRSSMRWTVSLSFARSFASAGIPVSKEPTGIYRYSVKTAGRRHLSTIWQSGRAFIWDVTVATTLADSYVPTSSVTAAAAAEAAASRKEVILWSPICSLILISADRCRDTGTDQWICCWLSSRAGAQDLLKVPGGATVCIPVPEAVTVSHCAAIQCCHFAWQDWQLSTKLGPLTTNGIVFIIFT